MDVRGVRQLRTMPEFLARASEALVSPVMGWEVNLARKLGAEATALWENADTNRGALTPSRNIPKERSSFLQQI